MSEREQLTQRPITRRTALGLGVAAAAGLHVSGSAAPAAATVAQVAGLQLGVYRWSAPNGPANVTAHATWLDVPTLWGLDFEAADTWDNISGGEWQLPPWSTWVQAVSGRQLVLSVPMLAGPWDLSGPTQGSGAGQAVSLAAGAGGAYNSYYQTLAQKLVDHGLGNSWIRLGWEFNGGWYTWRASEDQASWAPYWRQIVDTMRSVSGTDLRFVWNPALGHQQFPAESVYPGDQYVDYVGLDVYDESWAPDTYPFPDGASQDEIAERRQRAWDTWTHGGDHGIAFWLPFSSQHGKQLVFPEWGTNDRSDGHGGLDNPDFIQKMHDVMVDNSCPHAAYFDVDASDGAHQLSDGNDPNGNPVQTRFPNSAATYLELFGS